MDILKKDNRFLSLLIALFSFFILVFFTTNIYSEILLNIDSNNSNIEKLNKLDAKLKDLNIKKHNLENKNNLQSKKIKKFSSTFKENELISYINNYIENINKVDGNVVLFLDSISFSEEKKSELGFKEVNIDLKISKIRDKYVLTNLLDFLISDSNEYGFFITDFNFNIEKSGPYTVNIPLKMYIK